MSLPSEQVNERPMSKVVRSTAWLMSGRVLKLTIGVGVYVLVARYLRPADFGLLVSALALSSILEIVGRLGLNPVMVRDMVRKPDSTGELLATVIAMRFVFALLSVTLATALGFCAFSGDGTSGWVFPVVALALLPASVANSLALWFQARTEARAPVLMDTLAFLVSNSLRIFLLLTGGSLLGFALIPLVAKTVCAVGLALAVGFRDFRAMKLKLHPGLARTLVRENWPLVFSQIAGIVYLKVDQVMLATMGSPREAGVYAAALRISEVWYFVPAALCISLKPMLTRMRDRNPKRYWQILQALFSVMTLIVVAVALPMVFVADSVVGFLFGAQYAAASTVLTIHVWTALFVFWRRAQSEWLINEGHLKFALFRSVVGAAGNIALNLVLIPKYGAVGAAAATLVSAFLTTVPTNLAFAPARPILALQLRSLLLAGLLENVKRWIGTGARPQATRESAAP